MRRSIGASITNGAVSASQRRPAMKVWVFQCPNGALARSLRRLGQRPRKRVILVVAPLASRKRSRCGSRRLRGWRTSVHSSRACLMSGRSCSLARRVFFEPIAGANEPTRQRSRVSLLAARRGERARQFRHGDVGLLGHLRQKKGPMRLKLGGASPAARLGRKAPPRANRLHQVHHEGHRHPKARRSGASRLAVLDKADNPLTQIQRIRLEHRESPPAESESRNTPYRNPPRFNLRIRRSRAASRSITSNLIPPLFVVTLRTIAACSRVRSRLGVTSIRSFQP